MENNLNPEQSLPVVVGMAALRGLVTEVVKSLKDDIKSYNKNKKENSEPYYVHLISDEEVVFQAFEDNYKFSTNWSREISFKELLGAKQLSQVYVDIDFFLSPKRIAFQDSQVTKRSSKQVFDNFDRHKVILGGPGAGKTTLTKQLFFQLSEGGNRQGKFSVPFIIRLRDINSNFHKEQGIPDSIYYILSEAFGLSFKFPFGMTNIGKGKLVSEYHTQVKHLVLKFIDELNIAIILDGFDEINNAELKRVLLQELDYVFLSLNHSRIVITSRTSDFSASLPNSDTLEICPLTPEQIQEFIYRWFPDQAVAQRLHEAVKLTPYVDTTIRPINIAHICAIYEKYGSIPEKPKSIYKKIVQLLIEEWDAQRQIVRHSKYANFTPDRKFEFLSELAYLLTIELGKSSVTQRDLQSCYLRMHLDFGLPKNETKEVVKELEDHNGLFIQAGFDTYEFSHKSLQEYLAAEFLIRQGPLNQSPDVLLSLPNELAIATSLSSNPGQFMAHLLIDKLEKRADMGLFIERYLDRLLVERPDYTTSDATALAICYICDSYAMYNEPRTSDEKYLHALLNELLTSHPNMSRAFSELGKRYTEDGNFSDVIGQLAAKKSDYVKVGIHMKIAGANSIRVNRLSISARLYQMLKA